MTRQKRFYGDGLVRQRKDGLWEFRIRLTPGARPYTLYARSRKELLRKVAEEKARNGGTLKKRARRLTVRTYLTDFLENVVVPKLADQTVVAYRTWIGHALKIIGDIQLKDVDACTIDNLYATLRRENRGACTLAKIHAVLKRAWSVAVRKEIVSRNPFDLVERPRYETGEMRYLTVEETARLMEAAFNTRWYALIALLLATGVRIGEAAGLEWSDIDWNQYRIIIRRGQAGANGESKPTKTKSSRRSIEVDCDTMEILATHRKMMLREGHGSQTVFVRPDGSVLDRANFRKREWIPLVAAAGLKGITPHKLRHTHATMLMTDGENPKVVSERLGHKSIKITLDTYSHVSPAIHRRAAERAGELLYGRAHGGSGERADLNDRKTVIAAANRSAALAIASHREAGRSTYSGDAEHTFEHTAEGEVYLVEERDGRLERARSVLRQVPPILPPIREKQ